MHTVYLLTRAILDCYPTAATQWIDDTVATLAPYVFVIHNALATDSQGALAISKHAPALLFEHVQRPRNA